MTELDNRIPDRAYYVFFGWLGLITGVAEAMGGWVREVYLTESLFRNAHAIWMTPLAECLVFLTVGSVLWGLTCCLRRSLRVSVVVAALGLLSALSLAWGSLYLWAILMLGVGLASCLVRALRDRPDRTFAIVRWTTPVLILFVAAGALVQWIRHAEKDLVAATRPSPDAPNVVLIVWDTVRADSVDLRPGNDHTPNLAALARQGTVFDRAIAPASWTLPTHASLLTGLYPDQHACNWNGPLDESTLTLAEKYEQAGYATGGFVGNLYYCTRSTGLHRGFQLYQDHKLSIDEVLRHSFAVRYLTKTRIGLTWMGIYDELGRKDGSQVTTEFIAWQKRKGVRPFFAFLNYFDAHDPYLPDTLANGRRLTRLEKSQLRVWRYRYPETITEDELNLARECYTAQIHKLDTLLGDVIGYLKRAGQYERTLIVVTSDHGEMFGEHSLYSHGNSVHRPLVHVPLVMSLPGRVPVDRHVRLPVSLCDVGQTTLQVAGSIGAGDFPGESLAAAWTESTPARRLRPALATVDPHPRLEVFPHMFHSPARKGKQYALLTGESYVIAEGDETWHLYDFGADPGEATDLANRSDHAGSLLAAQQTLQHALSSTTNLDGHADTVTWLTRARSGDSTAAKHESPHPTPRSSGVGGNAK